MTALLSINVGCDDGIWQKEMRQEARRALSPLNAKYVYLNIAVLCADFSWESLG